MIVGRNIRGCKYSCGIGFIIFKDEFWSVCLGVLIVDMKRSIFKYINGVYFFYCSICVVVRGILGVLVEGRKKIF